MFDRGTSIAAAFVTMAQDFEQFLREIFGEPLNRLTNFSSEQMQRLNGKLQELAREAVKEEFTKLHTEITELRSRVAVLEAERAEAAADKV
jgi:DNA-binding transcriptional regulator GbsR (MarR family)